MSKPIKQIHLAAHFPGVNNTTVWSDPAAGSHIEFSSFAQFASHLLAGYRYRQRQHKLYFARIFVRCQPGRDMVCNFQREIAGRGVAFAKNQVSFDDLRAMRIWFSDYAGELDRRMPGKTFFDFPGADPIA